MKEKEYLTFSIAPYALLHVINALRICNVYDYSITLENNDLVVVIDRAKVDNHVYLRTSENDSNSNAVGECTE